MSFLNFFSSANGQLFLASIHLLLLITSAYLSFERFDNSKIFLTITDADRLFLPENSRVTKNFSVFVPITLFCAITFAAHVLYWSYLFFYNSRISLSLRWVEYGFSASIMLVIISMLSGVRDLLLLISILGLCATTMVFGSYGDTYFINNHNDYYIHPIIVGFLPYFFAWIPVTVQFIRAENKPTFVFLIYFFLLFLFSSFAVVQGWFVLRKQGSYDSLGESYLETYDGAMHLLSLVAKATLVLLVIGGAYNII